jgi:hypothetical protein
MNHDEILLKIGTSRAAIGFATTPARAFILISQLQLALRHPENDGGGSAIAREIAEHLTDALCFHIPEARALIELGWNPDNDVTRDYYDAEFEGGENG